MFIKPSCCYAELMHMYFLQITKPNIHVCDVCTYRFKVGVEYNIQKMESNNCHYLHFTTIGSETNVWWSSLEMKIFTILTTSENTRRLLCITYIKLHVIFHKQGRQRAQCLLFVASVNGLKCAWPNSYTFSVQHSCIYNLSWMHNLLTRARLIHWKLWWAWWKLSEAC